MISLLIVRNYYYYHLLNIGHWHDLVLWQNILLELTNNIARWEVLAADKHGAQTLIVSTAENSGANPNHL